MTPVLYLSRRNLETLLAKLDRQRGGETTNCTVLKSKDTEGRYPNEAAIAVVAVENDEYYSHRSAGEMHPDDEQFISKPETGVFSLESLFPPEDLPDVN